MPLIVADRLGQATTTTGTGAYTVGAAITALRTLDSMLSVNDFFYGYVEAVDADGRPTGDWECGKYTKTAAGVIARTEIHSSSNFNSAVNWAPGTKHIKLALTAYQLRYLDPAASGGATPSPTPSPSPSPTPSQPTPFGRNAALYGKLTFRDEFDGTAVNTSKWPMTRLWYEPSNYANRGNIDVSGGELRLWATPWASSTDPLVRYPNEGDSYKNHNATLSTDGSFWQRYGYFEAEMKMPRGKGPFPAFWLHGHADQNGTEVLRRPEIDIMECYPSGTVDKAWSTADNRPINHVCTVWRNDNDQIGYRKGNDVGFWQIDLSADYHKYGVHWDVDGFQFTFDGQDFGTKIPGSLTDPLYIVLDYWMGGESGLPNDPFGTLVENSSNSLLVRYVRAWELADGSTFVKGSAVESAPTPAPTVIDGTIDWYGNSVIFGWDPSLNGTAQEGQAVATPMPAAFNAHAPVSSGVNRGVNGTSAADALAGTDGVSWLDWSDHMNSITAKYVFIQYRENTNTTELTNNLTTLINEAKAAGKVVFVITEVPSLNEGSLTHDQIAAAQRQVALSTNVRVIDLNQYMTSYMATNGLSITNVCPDTQHPSQAYYTIMGQWIKDEFVRLLTSSNTPTVTPLPIPNNTVLLSDHGGVPGASGETIFNAWNAAVAQIKTLGGGTLKWDAGTYAMGIIAADDNVFHANNLSNVLVDMRGAIFTCTSTTGDPQTEGIGNLFYFENPNNVTVRGGKMLDAGYSATSGGNNKGVYFVRAQATGSSLCKHFKMFEAETDGAMGYFVSTQFAAFNSLYQLENIDISGTAKNTYYGAGLTDCGANITVDLTCINVRRAIIAYHPRNASFKINGTHDAAALGSNGYVSVIRTDTGRDLDSLEIDVTLTGSTNHTALVHFYHQFGDAATSSGWMQNVNAKVTINNLLNTAALQLFRFDHELTGSVIAGSTARGWKNIRLDAAITGAFSGTRIASASASTAAGNAVYVTPNVTTNFAGLPSYFQAAAV